jgi:hypothetical protein
LIAHLREHHPRVRPPTLRRIALRAAAIEEVARYFGDILDAVRPRLALISCWSSLVGMGTACGPGGVRPRGRSRPRHSDCGCRSGPIGTRSVPVLDEFRGVNEMEAVRQVQAGSPGKVYEAIAAVTAEMAREGIAKGRRNQQQGYQFRGIDDVYNALSPVLARHRLCILPRVTERVVQERETQRGGVLFYVTVKVEFDFVSAEDGSTHTVSTFGEAMDSADKATNKAMSAAYKYAAFQTFCIPTEGDNDADATTPEVGRKVTKAPAAAPKTEHPPIAAEDLPQDYFDLVDELEAARTKEELRQWALGTTARRAALPKGAQAKLRELTIEHQNSIKAAQMAAA